MLISLPSGEQKSVSIAHIQLEQDSGKTVQSNARNEVLVDLNRAGSGLMEIVSKPEMRCVSERVLLCGFVFRVSIVVPVRSSDEAGAYTRALQRLLRTVGSCTGNMDEVIVIGVFVSFFVCERESLKAISMWQGDMRCDVNVSVCRPNAAFGSRVEIKNVNSVKFLCSAIGMQTRCNDVFIIDCSTALLFQITR